MLEDLVRDCCPHSLGRCFSRGLSGCPRSDCSRSLRAAAEERTRSHSGNTSRGYPPAARRRGPGLCCHARAAAAPSSWMASSEGASQRRPDPKLTCGIWNHCSRRSGGHLHRPRRPDHRAVVSEPRLPCSSSLRTSGVLRELDHSAYFDAAIASLVASQVIPSRTHPRAVRSAALGLAQTAAFHYPGSRRAGVRAHLSLPGCHTHPLRARRGTISASPAGSTAGITLPLRGRPSTPWGRARFEAKT